MEIGEEARVKTAAHIFKKFCYDYRDSLSAGIICAGWDKYDGGQVKRREPSVIMVVVHLIKQCLINTILV